MQALRAALTAAAPGSLPDGALALLEALSGMDSMDVYICSAGSCGSSHLSAFLNRHGFTTNLQTDTDGLRHCNRPPPWVTAPARTCVYLYSAHPLQAVASHYRRGHAHHQAAKTCGEPHRLGGESAFPPTFEAYCAVGSPTDLFGLARHFSNWRRGSPTYDVLLVRYESMFEPAVARDLFQRLCSHRLSQEQVEAMAAEWVATFSARKTQVPEASSSSGMYEDLARELARLPPLMVVPRTHAASAADVSQLEPGDGCCKAP